MNVFWLKETSEPATTGRARKVVTTGGSAAAIFCK